VRRLAKGWRSQHISSDASRDGGNVARVSRSDGLGDGYHNESSRPIDVCYPQIIAVRDLARGMQLAWTLVITETAEEAFASLESLVRVRGQAAGAQERQRSGVHQPFVGTARSTTLN
jgi:hypothetical protein